ncbi:MAG: aldo/keto reductase [Dehalococcoidia bacterium]|nr:MAG: aldo/keto reductase [Dehalococcoidia bacterium]
MANGHTKLGDTNLSISKIGVGTWAWGSRILWGYGRDYTEADLVSVYEESLKSGVNFFDTAEIYGMGNSEEILGHCFQKSRADISPVIATKFFPFPWRLGKNALRQALVASLKRLGLNRVELYQIHQPVNINKWLNAIADVYEEGLINAVGVSNYNPEQLKRAFDILENRRIKLASNQVHYSLIHRQNETNGLLSLCQELKVTFLAYSPLAQGVLTGKYTPQNPPRGILRSRRYRRAVLERWQPLIKVMTKISEENAGKTLAQIALNWVLSKGAIPVVGAKNITQIKDNIAALDWQLSDKDVARLDKAANTMEN